jgi:hypothetical protein
MEEGNGRKKEEILLAEESLKEAEKYDQEEEGTTCRLSKKMDIFITAVAVIMSLFHLYAAVTPITPLALRGTFPDLSSFSFVWPVPESNRFGGNLR